MKEINKFIQETKKNLFAKWSVSDLLAVSAATRAQTGFGFIGRCLDKYPQGTLRAETISPPYSRQIDVLISYNFELLLDAGVFASFPSLNEIELLKKVTGQHSLDKKWKKVIDPNVKSLFDIHDILPPKENGEFKYYIVNLKNDDKLIIEDHIDIRFDIKDFRGQESKKLRPAVPKENFMDLAVKFSSSTAKKIIDYLNIKYR